jgi:hypothetical protein
VNGQCPVTFATFLSAMGPARARRDQRRDRGNTKPKPKATKSKLTNKSHGVSITCSYCSNVDDIHQVFCEELPALRRRVGGIDPTHEQMLQVGICRECSKLPIMKDLAKLVPMVSVMRKLGFLNKQKQKSKAS